MSDNKRKNDSSTKALLWIDSKNKCPICNNKLTLPIGTLKDLNKKQKEIYGNWIEYRKKMGHIGVIAHNISYSKVTPTKIIESFNKTKEIRSRKNKYEFINDLIKEKFSQEKEKYDDYYDDKEYKDQFVENYWNKIILCFSCSQKIDGKKFENIEEAKKFFQNIHSKTPYEQVKMILDLKKKKRNQSYTVNSPIENLLAERISIRFSTIEELYFIKESINTILNLENDETYKDINFSLKIDIFNEQTKKEVNECITEISKVRKLNEFVELINENISSNKYNKTKNKKNIFKNLLPKNYNKLNKEKKIFYKIELIFLVNKKENNNLFYCFFNLINTNNNLLRDRKDFVEFSKNIKSNSNYESAKNSNWISNSKLPNIDWEKKEEYISLKNLLFKQLIEFEETEKDNEKKKFTSFSIAYMARWGTGKTTIIRKTMQDLKDWYNVVEINLWHISNAFKKSIDEIDNSFVRSIIKEAITQLVNNPDLVAKYMDSSKTKKEFQQENDAKTHMISSLLQFNIEMKPETVFIERSKFLDQHIFSLSRVTELIFNNTYKPTIFIFDDIDRIEDEENIVKILDALVAFLSIPNSVYIIPIDESKVMKAIAAIKIGKDPYSYINKYFSYSIRAPFIPRLNIFKILEKEIKKMEWKKWIFNHKNKNNNDKNNNDKNNNDKNNNDYKEFLRKASSVFPTNHRSIKDYLNVFQNNLFILEKNDFVNTLMLKASLNNKKIKKNKKNELIMLTTILQINFPLLSDYFSHELSRKNDIFEILKKEDNKNVLENLLVSLKNPNNNKQYKLNVSDSQFWYSLLNIDISKKNYEHVNDLSEEINKSIIRICEKNDKKIEKLKILIIEKLELLNKILINFNISQVSNSSFKLLFWTLFTLAEINDENAIGFAEKIDIFIFLTQDQNDSRQHEEEIEKEKIDNFLKNVDSYYKKSFFEKVEYEKIIQNLISINFNDYKIKIKIQNNNLLVKIISKFIDSISKHINKKNFLNNESKEENILKDEINKFFNNFNDKTSKNILEHLNKNKWKEIIENEKMNEKINEIIEFDYELKKEIILYKLIKYIIESNREIIEFELSFSNDLNSMELEGKFNFNFLNKNKNLEFQDLIPNDLKTKIVQDKIINFIAEKEKIIPNIEEINNIIKKDKYTNKILQKNNFKNDKNICHFIEKNQDFSNLNKFDEKIISMLYEKKYFEENFEDVFKKSKAIFKKQIIEEDNTQSLLFNQKNICIKYIQAQANSKKIDELEFINKKKKDLKKSKEKEQILDIIKQRIELKQIKDKDLLIKLILYFDNENNELKDLFHKHLGFNQKLYFEGEKLYLSTPFSEVLSNKCKIDKEEKIALTEHDLLKKINSLNDKDSKKFFNCRINSNLYESIHFIFKYFYKKNIEPYRFFELPNLDMLEDEEYVNFSIGDLRKENNEKLINKIQENLSLDKINELIKKKMPEFRKNAILNFKNNFDREIKKFQEYGNEYNKQTYKEVTEKIYQDKLSFDKKQPNYR